MGEPTLRRQRRLVPVDLVLETGQALEPLASACEAELRWRLGREATALAHELGLAGIVQAEVRSGASILPVHLDAGGKAVPLTDDLVRRTLTSVAPGDAAAFADRPLPWTIELTNEWLARRLADDAADRLVREFVVRLAAEALRLTPRALLNDSNVEEYASREAPVVTGRAATAGLRSTLAFLLDLGVSLQPRTEIVAGAGTSSVSLDERLELLYKRLRSPYVEICLSDDDFARIGTGATGFEPELRRSLFESRGVLLPTLLISPTPNLEPGWAAVKINDRVGLPHRMVEQPATLTLESLEPLLEAVSGRSAPLLVSVSEVELQLARLHESFPVLVQTVLARCSAGKLTRFMRDLVREGVSVRDLKTLLDRLLESDTADGQLRLDDSVRGRLALQLSGQYAPMGRLAAIRVDPRLEERCVGSSRINGISEDDRRAICATVRELVRGSKAETPIVVLTQTAATRRELRETFTSGLGNVPVLARSELAASVKIDEIGTLTL